MMRLGNGRLWTCFGLAVIISLTAGVASNAAFFGLFGSRSKKKAVIPSKSLVVFPFDQGDANGVPEEYGAEVASYLRSMLTGNERYSVFLYNERLSPIQRGREDNTLKTPDVKPPFTGDDEEAQGRALKLARTLAADFYVVGLVEDYTYDAVGKKAQMTLTAELVDGKTGKLKGRYVVTGSADETCKASDEEEFRAVAAGKAVEALREQLVEPPKSDENAGEKTDVGSGPIPAPAS